jgi:hypothetical protein
MAKYGFSSLNTQLNPKNGNEILQALAQAGLIRSVRVVSIVFDETHPRWKDVGEYNGIGTIEYQDVFEPNPQTDLPLAKPLNTNNKKYPLKNEIVYVISFPNTSIGDFTSGKTEYYLDVVGLWNHPHHNAYPSNPSTPPESQQKDYIETEAGSARRVTDQSTEINLGKTFIERANIHPLQPYEGDVIYEGRWGNSIRLGSTIPQYTNWSTSGTSGDPIMILRNGQGEQSEEGWIPIIENVNNDDSSIYLTSTQLIPLQPSSISTLYKSYPKDIPVNINEYAGRQIILNSGRLVFNSNEDHILLSSNLSIGLNAVKGINIDTNGYTIINSPDIKLGSKDATEPILKGDITISLLSQLVQQLINLTIALKTVTPIAGPAVAPAAITLEPLLRQLKTSLETQTKSTVSKTI